MICIAVVAIFLSVTKQIDGKLSAVFFGFAIVGAFLIARYDRIKFFQHGDTKIEIFDQQVSEIKARAIEDVQKDVAAQKESLQLVIADANETRRKLEEQHKLAEALVQRISEAESELKKHEQKISETAKRAEEADSRVALNETAVRGAECRVQAAESSAHQAEVWVNASESRLMELNRANKDLALLLTKMTWLQVVTKNEFGGPRSTAAIQEIERELNRLVTIAIPNAAERNSWVQQLMSSLPKPQ